MCLFALGTYKPAEDQWTVYTYLRDFLTACFLSGFYFQAMSSLIPSRNICVSTELEVSDSQKPSERKSWGRTKKSDVLELEIKTWKTLKMAKSR